MARGQIKNFKSYIEALEYAQDLNHINSIHARKDYLDGYKPCCFNYYPVYNEVNQCWNIKVDSLTNEGSRFIDYVWEV